MPGHPTVSRAAVVATALWVTAILATPAISSWGGGGRLAGAVMRAACGRVCHQRPERSFATASGALPVCARCFGLYLGALGGAMLAWRRGAGQWPGTSSRPRLESRRVPLILAAAPTACEWAVEVGGLAVGSNLLRFACALPLGVMAAWVLVDAFGGRLE